MHGSIYTSVKCFENPKVLFKYNQTQLIGLGVGLVMKMSIGCKMTKCNCCLTSGQLYERERERDLEMSEFFPTQRGSSFLTNCWQVGSGHHVSKP